MLAQNDFWRFSPLFKREGWVEASVEPLKHVVGLGREAEAGEEGESVRDQKLFGCLLGS